VNGRRSTRTEWPGAIRQLTDYRQIKQTTIPDRLQSRPQLNVETSRDRIDVTGVLQLVGFVRAQSVLSVRLDINPPPLAKEPSILFQHLVVSWSNLMPA